MKEFKILLYVFIGLCFGSCKTQAQQEENKSAIETTHQVQEDAVVMLGRFESYEEGFFSFKFKNEDGNKDLVTFSEIEGGILKTYDLRNQKYAGKKFEIRYKVEEKPEIDPDGETQYRRVRTIVGLKLLDSK